MDSKVENMFGTFLRDKKNDSVIHELRHGEITIGRRDDNDIKIDHPTVSSRHARIYTYLTVSYIEDLKSTNGTFINGKRIDKHVLHPGDVIVLGEYQIVFDVRRAKEQQTRQASLGN